MLMLMLMLMLMVMLISLEPSRWLAANSSLQACLNQSGRRSAIDGDDDELYKLYLKSFHLSPRFLHWAQGGLYVFSIYKTKCSVCTPLASKFTRRGGSKMCQHHNIIITIIISIISHHHNHHHHQHNQHLYTTKIYSTCPSSF